MYQKIITALFFFIVSLLTVGVSFSEIYQYKDENGVWHYTDSPETVEDKELLNGTASASGLKNIEEYLYKKYTPETQVEKAAIATVSIEGTLGSGSGFFITSSGHIITNKHVIRGDKNQLEKADQYIEDVDESFEQAEEEIKYHQAQLEQFKEQLAKYREQIDSLSNQEDKDREERRYQLEMNRFEAYKSQVEKRENYIWEKKNKFKSAKVDYNSDKSIGTIQKHFRVFLKDKTELYAYVLSVSNVYDLALLKVDGSTTPSLKPNEYIARQGTDVFAIGSPGGIRDNVTSGIISGYDGQYIRTNAEIYPGNSGGPLVTREGEVIGINTLKKITYKYEGIGYAIPIGKALSEFEQYINQ